MCPACCALRAVPCVLCPVCRGTRAVPCVLCPVCCVLRAVPYGRAALQKAVGGGAAEGVVEVTVLAGAVGTADPLRFLLEDLGIQHAVKPIG